jgi:hypothetical protein
MGWENSKDFSRSAVMEIAAMAAALLLPTEPSSSGRVR